MSRGADPTDPGCVLVLQGGGALGAYQAGVYEGLAEAGHAPHWLAGISIGAINAALIAGNAAERRVEALRTFWEGVSETPFRDPFSSAFASALSPFGPPFGPGGAFAADGGLGGRGGLGSALFGTAGAGLANEAHARTAMLFGVAGFFKPRMPPPPLQPRGTPAAISFYDTAPLAQTLERLVDFDRLNDGPVRVAVGAVGIASGNLHWFDTAERRLDVRHVMASGALPPGFPPVEIDGESYWDGGLVSNTPLQAVLDEPSAEPRVVFQVDLFPARGEMPKDVGEVIEREKEIRYSSRTRLNTTYEVQRQATVQAARRLYAKLPKSLRDDPDARALAALPEEAGVDVVHLIYRSDPEESHSKDYEFSRPSMLEHWAAGLADTRRTLADPRWTKRGPTLGGVRVFDLLSERQQALTVTPSSIRKSRKHPP